MKPKRYNHFVELTRSPPFGYTSAFIWSQQVDFNCVSSCFLFQFSYHPCSHGFVETGIGSTQGWFSKRHGCSHRRGLHHLQNSVTYCLFLTSCCLGFSQITYCCNLKHLCHHPYSSYVIASVITFDAPYSSECFDLDSYVFIWTKHHFLVEAHRLPLLGFEMQHMEDLFYLHWTLNEAGLKP